MNFYIFISNSIQKNDISERFSSYNFDEYIYTSKLDFLHIDTAVKYLHKNLLYKKSFISNSINVKTRTLLTSKQQMHLAINDNLPEIYKKHIPIQYNFSKSEQVKKYFNNKKIWIIKPSSGTFGEGIFLAKSYEDFVKKLKTKIFLRPTPKGIKKVSLKDDKYVLSEFVNNPLLYDGYSFAARLHVLITGKKAFLINNTGWLSQPYKKFTLDSLDVEYHISNYKKVVNGKAKERTERKIFPKYFEEKYGKKKTDEVLEQMYEIIKETIKLVNIKCIENQVHCYQIWSYDFGITKDYNVKLYEINGGSPDESYVSQTKEHVPEHFLNTLFDNVIDVYFPPKNKVKKHPDSYLRLL